MNVIVLERVEGEMDSGSFKLQKGNDIFELAFDMGGTLAFLAINGDEVYEDEIDEDLLMELIEICI